MGKERVGQDSLRVLQFSTVDPHSHSIHLQLTLYQNTTWLNNTFLNNSVTFCNFFAVGVLNLLSLHSYWPFTETKAEHVACLH